MSPPVVLVHGFGGSGQRTWVDAGWVDILADEGRVASTVDLLGHGTAPRPHDPGAYGRLADHLADALPGAPVDAVGFSLGAQTLLEVATAEPTRFRRLVLAGIGDDLFDPPDAESAARLIEGGREGDLPSDPVLHHLVTLGGAPGADAVALAACLRRPRRPVEEAGLAAVDRPVLVVLGDRDHVGPADRLVDALPRARLALLRGVDHSGTPRAMSFVQQVVAFLAG